MKPFALLLFAALALPCRAEEPLDLDAWWRDSCLWEVGSNLEKVPAARKKMIEAGAPSLDYLIPSKLNAADTIITRAFNMIITGICGAGGQKKDAALWQKAVDGLTAALENPDGIVRRNAADLLGQLGAQDSAPKIAKLLSDKDARGGALTALGALKAASSVPEIAAMARSADAPERARFTAVATLGAIGGPAAQEALLTFLGDKASPVRYAAQYALEAMRATGALLTKINDPDRRTRLHAINALGRLADRATRADLKPLLDDPDPTIRGFVVEALTAMSKPSDETWIRHLLTSERDPFVKGKLGEALKRVLDPPKPDDPP